MLGWLCAGSLIAPRCGSASGSPLMNAMYMYAVDLRDVHIGPPKHYCHQSTVTSLPIAHDTNGPSVRNHPPRRHDAKKVDREKLTGIINWPPLQDGIPVTLQEKRVTEKRLQD